MVTVQDFRDAWANKADREPAMEIARQYVEQERAMLEPILGGKTRDELVKVVDLCRAAGNHNMATAATMWELVTFPRQQIGGDIRPGGRSG
ncbi:MAG: hypothetical protein AB7I38_18470 [Dehalococcoidia bacterium]